MGLNGDTMVTQGDLMSSNLLEKYGNVSLKKLDDRNIFRTPLFGGKNQPLDFHN